MTPRLENLTRRTWEQVNSFVSADRATSAGGDSSTRGTSGSRQSSGFSGESAFTVDTSSRSAQLPNLTGESGAPGTTSSTTGTAAQPAQGEAIDSLSDVRGGVTLGEGSSGQAVNELQELIGVPQTGVFDQATGDRVAQLKEQFQLGGDPRVVGETTLRTFQRNLSAQQPVADGVSVNTNHPHLQALATGELRGGRDHTCVPTTRANMNRLGVPSFGPTAGDPNNSRSAMTQLLASGNWTSLPLPGAEQRTLNSEGRSVQANILSGEEFAQAAREGRIPEGAIVCQTQHGWNYSGGPYGNDIGIWNNGGVFNFAQGGPLVYGSRTREVVVLVPSDSVIRE